MGPTALRPIRRTKQWLSVLLKDTSVTAGDSNTHSADQKHQRLNLVLLTAWPRHFHIRIIVDFEGPWNAVLLTLTVFQTEILPWKRRSDMDLITRSSLFKNIFYHYGILRDKTLICYQFFKRKTFFRIVDFQIDLIATFVTLVCYKKNFAWYLFYTKQSLYRKIVTSNIHKHANSYQWPVFCLFTK